MSDIKVGDRLEIMMEDVEILPGNWRNFSGKQTQYNDAGKRNFNVLLPPALADQMARDGWNVKLTKERELDDETIGGEPFIKVSVKYTNRPPQVVMITSRGRTFLGEKEIDMLDWAVIKTADVKLSGKAWEVAGKPVMSAYLTALYVTIEEDYLQQKYADLPMAGGQADDFDPDANQSPEGMDGAPDWAN